MLVDAHHITSTMIGTLLRQEGGPPCGVRDADLAYGYGDDSYSVKWLVGEDLFPPWYHPDGRPALRDMKNPAEAPYYDADRKGSPYWHTWLANSDDNGGIHTNCGVANKLCYLLTDGDTFNGYTIHGMGIDQVARLMYEVQANLLTRAADYEDLYFALLRAADLLDWAPADKQNIERACRAVEIAAVSSTTREYSAGEVPKYLPDNGTTTSMLTIDDAGTMVDLDVKLSITHSYDGDLDVHLFAPDGTRVELFTDVGGSGDNFSNTVLDDEASLSIAAGSAPFSGSYRLEGTLGDFDGRGTGGTWRLEIADDSGSDVGTLVWWSLIVTTANPNLGLAAPDTFEGQ